MYTIYRTSAEELDQNFLDSLRAAFKGKQIEIAVCETDETDYLLRTPENRERLLKAVEDIEHQRNLITPDQTKFG
jgi:antitoxin YefM